MRKIETNLKLYTYEQYKKRAEKIGVDKLWTPEEFEEAKLQTKKAITSLHQEYRESANKITSFEKFFLSKWSNMSAELGAKALHMIMFPIFFHAAHKNPQDLGAILDSTWEIIGFTQGAKLGGKLPGPVLWKMLLGIGTGIGTVAAGRKFGEVVLDMDKNFTRHFPNREDFLEKFGKFDDKRNWFMYMLSSFGSYEIADILGMDIGLYRTPITLAQHDIDLSTNPREFLGLGYVRDATFWNNRIEDFKKRLVLQVRELFYTQDVSYVSEESTYGPKRMKKPSEFNIEKIRSDLYHILISKNQEDMLPFHKEIVERLVNYILNLAPKILSGEVSFDALMHVVFVQIDKCIIYPSVLGLSYLDTYKEENDFEKELMQMAMDGKGDIIEKVSEEDLKFIASLGETERNMIKKKIYQSTMTKKPIEFSHEEKKMWGDLMGEEYFYTSQLSSSDKESILKIYQDLYLPIYHQKRDKQNSLLQRDSDESYDVISLNTYILKTLLDKPIIKLSDPSISPVEKQFLLAIMTGKGSVMKIINTQSRGNTSEGGIHWGKPTFDPSFLSEVSKKTHGGNLFYTFFTRVTNLKRKEEFYESMKKTGLPHKVQTPEEIGRNLRGKPNLVK